MKLKKYLVRCAAIIMVVILVITGFVIVVFQSTEAQIYYEIILLDKDRQSKPFYNIFYKNPLHARLLFPFHFVFVPDMYKNDRILRLHHLDVSGFDFNKLRVIRSEIDLDLRHSNVTDSQLKTICQFKNITVLSLSGCTNITDDGVHEIPNLENLQHLYLEETSTTDAGVRALKDMPKLSVLILHNTHVNGSAFCGTDGWQNLRVLKFNRGVPPDIFFDYLPNMPLRSLHFSVNDDNRLPPNIENLLLCKELHTLVISGKNLQDESDEGLPVEILDKLRGSFRVRVFKQPESNSDSTQNPN